MLVFEKQTSNTDESGVHYMTTYTLSHYLEPWLLPPGCHLFLMIVGIGIYAYWHLVGRALVLLGFITLWLASAPIVAYNLIEILQSQYPPLVLPKTLVTQTPRGVIVVLGGGDTTNVEQGVKLTVSDVTLNRIRYAAFLHHQTNLPLIVSGGNDNGSKETEAALMKKVLQDNFNIINAIKEDKSINTAEEGKFLAPLLKTHHFEVVYLVTNAWHMPRSVYVFKQEGIKVIPAPMGYEVYDHRYSILSYFPNIQALYTTSIAMHEFIGLLWYHIKYSYAK